VESKEVTMNLIKAFFKHYLSLSWYYEEKKHQAIDIAFRELMSKRPSYFFIGDLKPGTHVIERMLSNPCTNPSCADEESDFGPGDPHIHNLQEPFDSWTEDGLMIGEEEYDLARLIYLRNYLNDLLEEVEND